MNLQLSYISSSETKDIQKFLKKLLAFALLFFVLDKGLAYWATQAVLSDTQSFGTLTVLYSGDVNSQMVFFGSSKTHVNIDAELIEQQTGMSAYNLAIGNSSIAMHEFLFVELLNKNKKPDTVFIEADFVHLTTSTIRFRSELLAPFSNVSSHTAQWLNPTLADRLAFWFFRCKNFSAGEGIGALSRSMFRYAQNVFTGNNQDDTPQTAAAAGYQDNHQWRDANGSHLLAPTGRDIPMGHEERYVFSPDNHDVYLRIVELAKSEGILVVLYEPPFTGTLNDDFAEAVDLFFTQLAEQNDHVHYWSFREDPDLVSEASLWNDRVHMNWNGAKILSQKIAEKIVTMQQANVEQ